LVDSIEKRIEYFKAGRRCLLLTHNNPDPDSIASAFGLKILLEMKAGLEVSVAYGGFIGRAENRAMVSLLGLNLQPIDSLNPGDFDYFGLVDTQPDAGNNSLPPGHAVDIVVDHHPASEWKGSAHWFDLRPEVGATTTLIYQYLKQLDIPIDSTLATALLYGIISDTMDLGRGGTDAEFQAYLDLLPVSDMAMLSAIRHPNLTFSYYRQLTGAMETAIVYGNRLVGVMLEAMPYPDLPAELADYFVRAEGITIAFCGGCFNGDLYYSLRVGDSRYNAGKMIKSITADRGNAGGHGHMAGGVIRGKPGQISRHIGDKMIEDLVNMLGLRDKPAKRLLDLAEKPSDCAVSKPPEQ
jgi:nanoRNase/pAp phosphatase (c-di-AMP/oligoRNAs hydrolase)